MNFWTFSCVNSLRALPYLKAWQNAYGQDGFTAIGVNTPEFGFEQSADNVRKAMTALGID
ncbi:hypothetical protein FJU08_22450 [Martelella alba]|uniref:Uncharacterized protein n=1 Tax=Martelella alba TaxID=2590451 RepID=A0A506TYE4_9HYPH|nr:hypothetical protein [Martelella alba]TPW26336.1 hypothetical protein FJU08_22450 [Martelella alba]